MGWSRSRNGPAVSMGRRGAGHSGGPDGTPCASGDARLRGGGSGFGVMCVAFPATSVGRSYGASRAVPIVPSVAGVRGRGGGTLGAWPVAMKPSIQPPGQPSASHQYPLASAHRLKIFRIRPRPAPLSNTRRYRPPRAGSRRLPAMDLFRVTHTKVQSFLRCRKQYWFNYVSGYQYPDEEETPPIIIGNAVHRGCGNSANQATSMSPASGSTPTCACPNTRPPSCSNPASKSKR